MASRKSKAPGLLAGKVNYWVAARASTKAKDYPIKTIRLLPGTEAEIAAQCRHHTAELRAWLAERDGEIQFDGTIRSLIDCYRGDPDSPYHSVKANTRRDYDNGLDLLRKTVGEAAIAVLTGREFIRWHRALKAPKEPGGPERLRRAQGCMKVLRIVAGYGASMRYAGCRDMRDVLGEMRFEMPAVRSVALSFAQAAAIVDRALERDLRSIALAQALQFETTLRQKDVIGEWLEPKGGDDDNGGSRRRREPQPSDNAQPSGGIVAHGRRWANGLLWSDLDGTILRKRTSKTGAVVEFDLSLYPLVMRVIGEFEPEERVGPMVVSEVTALPYRQNYFGKTWRRIADAAGVPRDVWNMDSRAGGLSEGGAAGANIDDLRRHAAHSDVKMTTRYTRDNLPATERVARLRVASRKKTDE